LIVLGGERHANQVRQAPRLHLFHDPGAVDLDGSGADIELRRDPLVGIADHEAIEHLALARRKPV
jgi:hypothetical protein